MDFLQKSLSSSSSSSSFSFIAYPFSIDSELWHVAEERIREILCIIQPALASEQKRKEVIDHVRMLIQGYYATEVIPFGSVPLKTYLPDGDIDLTALSQPNKEEELAREVCNILKYRENDPNSEVTDVRYIDAQVKVVKCCVKDISIDISFNQIPGLCTLCFLEKVDRLIGKNHLLKHSIILIKAWCFYESRILGAYHGLISTYALEILVLHIINIFHSSLPGPLAVLHRFLEYYSTFDWDNYCVGINGPVAISSLRGTAAESQDNATSGLLLPPEFLRSCREEFSVPVKAIENGGHEFPLKHLNILDPLKYDNNLGRSVSKGNFHRIKCALNYGAQRLGKILMQQGTRMGERLEDFFKNTLDRNGKGERPDTPVPVPAFGTGKSQASNIRGDYDNYYNSLMQSQWYINMCSPPLSPQISPPLSPTQLQPRDNWHKVSMVVQFEQNTYSQRGTNVYVSTLAPCYPYVSQPYGTTSGIEQLGKSRGTGTYIPNVRSRPYRDLLSSMRPRSPGPRYYSPFSSPQATREVEPKEMKKQDNGCHDLSMDQFPLLPSHNKPSPSENGQPIFQSLQTKEYSNSMEFGIDRTMPSPLSQPSSVPESESVVPLTPEMPESESVEIKKQENGCHDLSLDQFPLLPSHNKPMPIFQSLQTKEKSTSIKSMEFETYRTMPSRLSQLPSVALPESESVIPVTPEMPESEPVEIKKQENGCHDLSLDQFPLLPSHNKPMPIFQSLQTKENSTSIKSMEFETYRTMPSPLSQLRSVALPESKSVIPVTPEMPESESESVVPVALERTPTSSSETALPNQQE